MIRRFVSVGVWDAVGLPAAIAYSHSPVAVDACRNVDVCPNNDNTPRRSAYQCWFGFRLDMAKSQASGKALPALPAFVRGAHSPRRNAYRRRFGFGLDMANLRASDKALPKRIQAQRCPR